MKSRLIKARVTRTIVLIAVVLSVGLNSAVADVRQQLEGFEWQLVPLQWQARDQIELSKIALSKQELPFVRARALKALTLFVNGDVLDVYESIIKSDETTLRRRAVDCLCEWPSEEIPIALLQPLLSVEDKHLAVRAAKCLASRHGRESAVADALSRFAEKADDWQVRSSGLKQPSL